MRFPAPIIASALNLFYERASLESIRRHIKLEHQDYPGHATVYDWIVKYTKKALKEIGDIQVHTGDVWAADETVLKVAGSRTKEGADNTIWFWDVIDDQKTKFLLASHMSQTRTSRDAETLFNRAVRKVRRAPKFIITDRLAAYQDGIERAFGSETTHVQSRGMRSSTHNNIIERFHGTIKQRTKVMRGLHSKETAQLVMDGWLIHYNFFRPHQSLKGKTPGEVAGAEIPFTGWQDVVTDRKAERNPKRVRNRKAKVTLLKGKRKR
jgi:transposase-like protein